MRRNALPLPDRTAEDSSPLVSVFPRVQRLFIIPPGEQGGGAVQPVPDVAGRAAAMLRSATRDVSEAGQQHPWLRITWPRPAAVSR